MNNTRLSMSEMQIIVDEALELFNSKEISKRVQSGVIKAIKRLEREEDSSTESMDLHIAFIDKLMTNKARLSELRIEMSF